jgi:fucose permease
MKVLFGILGAVIGVAAGFLFLGSFIGDWMVATQPQESPDDVSTTHALAYLVTTFALLVIGWFLGSAFGGLFSKEDD